MQSVFGQLEEIEVNDEEDVAAVNGRFEDFKLVLEQFPGSLHDTELFGRGPRVLEASGIAAGAEAGAAAATIPKLRPDVPRQRFAARTALAARQTRLKVPSTDSSQPSQDKLEMMKAAVLEAAAFDSAKLSAS